MKPPTALLPLLLVLLSVPWVGQKDFRSVGPGVQSKSTLSHLSGVPDTHLPPGAGLPQQDDLFHGGFFPCSDSQEDNTEFYSG